MGRIKTQLIKRTTKEIMEKHKDKVKDNFDDNKKVVEENTDVTSKKLRNVIAGYMTRLKRHDKIHYQ
jgi:small subunit ribosomal protein S17e